MSLVLIDRIEGGAIVRLNRPEKKNAVNDALAAAAIAAFDDLAADDSVRAIVLTGSGDAFCAGQDMGEASGRVERSGSGAGGAGGLAARIAKVEVPVIAAINGICMGGGCVVALNCDIRFCSDDSRFRFPGAGYGLVVAAAHLPAAVGQAAAKDLVFTGRTLGAAEAAQLGLVNRSVTRAELEPLAVDYVRMIAGNSPSAVRHAKRVINLAALDNDAIEHELEANRQLRGGPDHVARFDAATTRVTGLPKPG
ncbi:MAG: enoyl-CoA hydratase/isomerase family protein [Dehalococcoidia bacterium]